jgi:hypothetical protein
LKTKCKNKKGERRDEKKAPKTKESQCEKKAYTRNKVRESNRKGATVLQSLKPEALAKAPLL